MTRLDIFDTIDRLRRSGEPFCVATVVRTADVTSAKAGAKAAITSGGEIIGHLGGACVERAVRDAAATALQSGETRLIRVKPPGRTDPTPPDIDLYGSGCPSGGTADILIEAYCLAPQIVIFGTSPIARALEAHAQLLGFRVATPAGSDCAGLGLEPSDFVVIASQGSGDMAALRAALDSPVERISMVASRRKAETLKARLATEGPPEARLARIKAPAGLDLGGLDPGEIAISILAELISWRNERRLHSLHGEGPA